MNPKFEPLQKLSVTIDRLAYGGDGVAHPDGFTVFVPRTAPGDQATIQIKDVRRRYARAVALQIDTPSPHRISPRCPHFSRCGGCHYQHLNPNFIQEQKMEQIQESLQRMGPGRFELEPIYAPKLKWNYRNRVTYHRHPNGAQGYIAWDTYEVLDIDECPIAAPALNELWKRLKDFLKAFPSEQIPFAVLRETTAGQKAVILSFTEELNAKSEKTLLAFAQNERGTSFFLTKVQAEARSPFGKEFRCIHGEDELIEKVGEISYTLRPDLFFQIHPEVTERIVNDVVAWALPVGNRLLDLYCGAGLFSLALAKEGKSVWGVEIHYASVLSAQKSALLNHLEASAQFRGGKTDTVLWKLLRQKEMFDAAIVDPPRRGLGKEVITLLQSMKFKSICYVSCSPPTMARDLKELVQAGYRIQKIQPYDMFPQTYHMETVTFLEKVS